MAKKPKFIRCVFLAAWRGHREGAVADLTEERADELVGEGVCAPAPDAEITAGLSPLAHGKRAATPAAAADDEETDVPATKGGAKTARKK